MNNPLAPRVLFWGTRSAFSGTVFQALQHANIHICALFVHAQSLPWQREKHPRRVRAFPFPSYTSPPYSGATQSMAGSLSAISLDLPTWDSPTCDSPIIDHPDPLVDQQINHSQLEQTTGHHPQESLMYEVPSLQSPKLAALIRALQPDVACVACFPKRIPSALLSLPKHGFFNVHPSLLPAHRGPAPLFWIFRSGAQATAGGVTIHRMDAAYDTGHIVAQSPVELPNGISGPEADQRCASQGGNLLVQVLGDLANGNLCDQLQAAGGSYQGWPQATDFQLETGWSAQRAFNFMRGTAEWAVPYHIWVDGELRQLQNAISYNAHQKLSSPLVQSSEFVAQIQFSPGVLTARISPAEPPL